MLERKGGATPELLSVVEAKNRFRGKWVLMQVTAFNEHENPVEGKILSSSGSRKHISEVLAGLPSPSQQTPPEGPYFIFHAPPHLGATLLNFAIRNLGS